MRNVALPICLSLALLTVVGCERKVQQPTAAAGSSAAKATVPSVPSPNIKFGRWGPEATPVGEVFNKQPSGLSAIWFELTTDMPPTEMQGWFGDQKLDEISVTAEGGALLIPTDLLRKPGKSAVYLLHVPSKRRYDLGSFEVLPGAKDIPAIKFAKWGPQVAQSGEPFNKQPNGFSAIWFEMSGSVHPQTMEGWVGSNKVKELVVVSNLGGSLHISLDSFSKAGKYPVYLVHAPSKTRFDIGVLEVSGK